MRVLDWSRLDAAARREALTRPEVAARAEVTPVVEEVIATVRRQGDEALREFTRRFDGLSLQSFEVTHEEFAAARRTLTPAQTAALERALRNVRAFHRAQLPRPVSVETEPGVRCEQLIRPIESVGLYVPAGSAPLPSAVIMLAAPAEIAGCPRRILCTPPMHGGAPHPAVLVAAELCGIDTVFKVGGAQAIAALAYGTQTIPRVEKIFGPGNAWVTAAKRLVASDPGGAACDLTAGPSEVLVVADDTARADFVAADLLAQAEHDVLAQALLVTVSAGLARQVAARLASRAPRLPRREILAASLMSCRAIVVPDLAAALEVANAYAPEHLILHTREPRQWLPAVRNAGAVFLGEWSPEPLGDYCTGANHVLPTAGSARTASGLSVRDFLKTICVQELTLPGLRALSPTAVALAALEGLEAHAQAITRRLELEGSRA
jgi:histidinol dehydrogenase